MKIKVREMSYDQVMALPRPARKKPKRPNALFRAIVRLAAMKELKKTGFTFSERRMELVGDRPCLILMNHSSFLDLQMAARIFKKRPYCIVCTSDGFVGKEWLMRQIGCIPTRKFVSDLGLVRDLLYCLHENKTSVLMYPEASYSFDGTATALPRRMGVLLKKLAVPVVMVRTYGAFAYDPLYNCLQTRRVLVHADVSCLLTPEEIAAQSVEQLDDVLDSAFTFDNFEWQRENGIAIHEDFRADGLERILYRCACCGAEGQMEGRGTGLTCRACGKHYEMDEHGVLHAADGDTEFPHIPDWYAWERRTVREELLRGDYQLSVDVRIGMMVDYKAIYMVGNGHLRHDENGFELTGCDGRLHYTQSPLASYGLYSDYFWYELGDVICIGDHEALYYCFPPAGTPVAKARLAAEELFKLKKAARSRRSAAKGE